MNEVSINRYVKKIKVEFYDYYKTHRFYHWYFWNLFEKPKIPMKF